MIRRLLPFALLLATLPAYAAITYVDHEVTEQSGQGSNINIDMTALKTRDNGQDGDIMVAYVSKDDDPLDSPNPGGEGWVEVLRQGTFTGGDAAIGIWYREITSWSTEPDDYTFSGDSEQRWGVIVIFRGINTTDVLDATPVVVENIDSASPFVTTLTPDNGCALILYTWNADGNKTVTEPSGPTTLTNNPGSGGGHSSLAAVYEIQGTTAEPTGTVTWTGLASGDDSLCTAVAFRSEECAAPPAGRTRRTL